MNNKDYEDLLSRLNNAGFSVEETEEGLLRAKGKVEMTHTVEAYIGRYLINRVFGGVWVIVDIKDNKAILRNEETGEENTQVLVNGKLAKYQWNVE